MNLLLVNDDGIEAAGLRALADRIADLGTLYVCAPMHQSSGESHAITLTRNIRVEEVDYPGAALAWRVDGTPADCAKAGLQFCEDRGIRIDLVFSGINMGANLGADTLYSGTVGAAMEAALLGYHSVAVSVYGHHATHYDGAARLARQVIGPVLREIPTNIIININTPDIPAEAIKGVKTAPLGPSYYVDRFEPKGEGYYHLEGVVPDYDSLDPAVDVALNRIDYATITPLQMDFTEHRLLETVDAWRLTI